MRDVEQRALMFDGRMGVLRFNKFNYFYIPEWRSYQGWRQRIDSGKDMMMYLSVEREAEAGYGIETYIGDCLVREMTATSMDRLLIHF